MHIHFLPITLACVLIHTYIHYRGKYIYICFLKTKILLSLCMGGVVGQGGMVRSSMVSLSLTWVWLSSGGQSSIGRHSPI